MVILVKFCESMHKNTLTNYKLKHLLWNKSLRGNRSLPTENECFCIDYSDIQKRCHFLCHCSTEPHAYTAYQTVNPTDWVLGQMVSDRSSKEMLERVGIWDAFPISTAAAEHPLTVLCHPVFPILRLWHISDTSLGTQSTVLIHQRFLPACLCSSGGKVQIILKKEKEWSQKILNSMGRMEREQDGGPGELGELGDRQHRELRVGAASSFGGEKKNWIGIIFKSLHKLRSEDD